MAIHYENAPISEALLDIKAEVRSAAAEVELLDSIHDRVRMQYPRKNKSMFLQGELSVGDAVGASAMQTVMGFAFTSEDRKQIFQARRDGFTFSRLRPYSSWCELRDEARRLWDIYREVVNPEKVTRVGVRYVNQIDIPLMEFEYKDYFRTIPEKCRHRCNRP